MTRVKRSVHARKKRRATLERTKGFRGEANSNYKRAKEALMKADSYAYRDRRNRKRDFRRLWITRINAAARQNGMTLRAPSSTASSWPASSSTARSWPTSPCATPRPSADLPRPPARRRRRPEHPPTPTASRAPLHQDGALFCPMTMITSPHNDKLKEIRKLARPQWRDKLRASSPRARTCSPPPRPPAGAARRGSSPRAPGSTARRSSRTLLAAGLRARLGHARARRLRAALVAAPAGPLCVALWGVGDPGNVGTILRSRAGLRRGERRARPRHAPTRSGPRPCGPRWARSSRCRVARVRARRRAARRGGSRSSPRDGRAAAPSSTAARARCVVGAEREGLPAEVVAACDEVAHIPIARESLNAAMAATVALYEARNVGSGAA